MTAAEWTTIRYFKPNEFDSKDAPGSGFSMMDYALVSRLDALRAAWGAPLRVTSGYRTLAHNTAVGGVKDSAHLRGLAADLMTVDLKGAIKLAVVAGRIGFTRVGVDLKGKLVHVDVDLSLPNPAVWFYNEQVLA